MSNWVWNNLASDLLIGTSPDKKYACTISSFPNTKDIVLIVDLTEEDNTDNPLVLAFKTVDEARIHADNLIAEHYSK